MRDPARLQAAIEILDEAIAAAGSNGAAADTLAQRYFASRRYAGSKDRAAVRELLFQAIRFSADRPPSGRALMLALAEGPRPDLLPLFDGSPHAPALPEVGEPRGKPGLFPEWLRPQLQRRFGAALDREAQALIARAPLDLRVNALKADPAEVAAELGGKPISSLPLGLRLEEPLPLERHPLMQSGAIEVQDAGSQFVAAAARAMPGETVVDLCAGAGGKTLALPADMRGEGRLVASDTDRGRLQAMRPRLERAGLQNFVEPRLLNPGREAEALADLAGAADLVLVDAPCSGTGTWRRNPELRWRLTPQSLERLLVVQARLMALGASLLKPGGRLVYAVCSVLPAEGEDQARQACERLGLKLAGQQAYSPAGDGTDGFFVASLGGSC
ncbi:RsmB/NOP family class I SAM-dependent RNA methyltransferase [Sandaracinobacter sp. RS1-74]|uniref:RsmB/NOP family class I SAM-dependent RNA methyltransferase n=1 Tax=Sandaracinobacteroides sayramensis TaxID=2913411 RepID=UPI001EDB5F60|nr:RsmB/NOP family class I SAM-dependent RNA methyltransferase [Sandaracinobacteroides sayramensis]MCG2842340.1 RsmB/NOP family class I SAM-dependent RNA methyltransferase [Sandaracinobacteroides sayramensis]